MWLTHFITTSLLTEVCNDSTVIFFYLLTNSKVGKSTLSINKGLHEMDNTYFFFLSVLYTEVSPQNTSVFFSDTLLLFYYVTNWGGDTTDMLHKQLFNSQLTDCQHYSYS